MYEHKQQYKLIRVSAQTTIQINTCMSTFKTDFVNKHAIEHPTRPLCGRCQTIEKVEGTDQ